MENRHSSRSAEYAIPRPSTHRQRSNSFPIVEALGCSAAEAEIILAEGRAAVRTRSLRRRGRRNLQLNNGTTTFRPQDHMQYLNVESSAVDDSDDEPVSNDRRPLRHSRVSSNATDRSTSTVTRPVRSSRGEPLSPTLSPTLGDYSANLAKFIQSQLNSIPTYTSADPSTYPRSCPDLSSHLRSPPQSPMKPKRPMKLESGPILEMPPVRPPLRSTFSEWSSTDEEDEHGHEDNDADEVPPLPDLEISERNRKPSIWTPSILAYYENASAGSFPLTSTPSEADVRHNVGQHPNANDFSFPMELPTLQEQSEAVSPGHDAHDYHSSSASTHPQLTSSSAPSFSSTSTGSYFDYKRPITFTPHMKDRITAAVSPHPDRRRVLTAISPFEGGALTNVHDIFVESNQRVIVEGLSFDLIRELKFPEEGVMRVQTPC